LIDGEVRAGGVTAAQARKLRQKYGEDRLLAVFNMMQATSFMRRNAAASASVPPGAGTGASATPRSARKPRPRRANTHSPETKILLDAGLTMEEVRSLRKRGLLGPATAPGEPGASISSWNRLRCD
jgi:hypothetical protein